MTGKQFFSLSFLKKSKILKQILIFVNHFPALYLQHFNFFTSFEWAQ
jgi:hypothetical protein